MTRLPKFRRVLRGTGAYVALPEPGQTPAGVQTWDVETVFVTDEPISQEAAQMFWAAGDHFTTVGPHTYRWRLRLDVIGAGLSTVEALIGGVSERVVRILLAADEDILGVSFTDVRITLAADPAREKP